MKKQVFFFPKSISLRFSDYSLRVKLIIAFLLVSALSVGVVAFITNRTTQNELFACVEQSLAGQASVSAFAVGAELDKQVDGLRTLAFNGLLEDGLGDASAAASGDLAEMERLDQQWRAADAAGNDAHSLVQAVLNHPISNELHEMQKSFPQHAELFVTDRYGGIVAATNRTSDYYQADEEWWQIAYNNGEGAVFIGQPEFDESSQTIGLQIGLPVFNESSEIVGVLRSTVNIKSLGEALEAGLFGQSGRTEIYLPDGSEIEIEAEGNGEFKLKIEKSPADFVAALQHGGEFLDTVHGGVPTLGSQTPLILGEDVSEDTVAFERLDWRVVALQDRAEALLPVTNATRAALLSALGALLAAGLLAVVVAQFLTGPITRLTQAAEKVSSGDLQARAPVESRDETGVLAGAFNTMTAQLEKTLTGLESRVAERTTSLVLAAEVGRSVSQVRDLGLMLKDAAEIIRSRFDLYYAQVYLTNPAQNALLLQAGTGTVGAELVGRGHRLPLNTASINGRAAVEKHSVVISDTAASTNFRPNPLLPDTKSEMAVPLMVGEIVVGVLDLQSEKPGTLNQDILSAFEALAGQLAIAIQNANLLAETEKARAEVEAQARRLVRKNWEEHLDAIHQPEHTGFIFEGNKITSLADATDIQTPDESNAITAPITITGESLGTLVVEMDAQNLTTQNTELVNSVALQVAQQIENLRLLESAERYRSEAEQAARRATIEGWKEYVESKSGESLGYLYDTNEVRPHKELQVSDESAMTLPIKAREETVGKLSVMGLESHDSEALDLASAVAERLGAHIENLRLFEETKRGQIELDKRARELAAVAEVSSVSAKELDIQKMLATVVQLTQRKFGLYHAHVFTYNEDTAELKIAACGWKEGEENEGPHDTASIPLNQEQSLVALAARTRQAVIVNDVYNEPGWLPNPLLPDTASEMAIPLLVGDQLLGVLDVQKDYINAFTEEDASIQTTLASQVATAMQNARSFAKAQQQADREATLNVIGQKIQSATTVESVLQIAARELGRALGAPLTIAQLGIKENSDNGGSHR